MVVKKLYSNQKLISALLVVIFLGACFSVAQAKTDSGRARPLSLQELNALRSRSKQKIRKGTAAKKSATPQEVEKLLGSPPSESSLIQALSLREQLEKYNPSLEEFIIDCYWQLGEKSKAISLAQALLNANESKTAHRIMFYHSLAVKKIEEAEFHFSRADFRGFNWLINFFHLHSEKLHLSPVMIAALLLLSTIALVIPARFIFAAMRKKPQQPVANPTQPSKIGKSKVDEESLQLPPMLGLLQEKRQMTFSTVFGLQEYELPASFEFSSFKAPKNLAINSLVEAQNEILFEPNKFGFSFNPEVETNRSNADSIISETQQKQSESPHAKAESSFDFINSSKICLPAMDFNHFDDLQTEESAKILAPILKRLASMKDKVTGITSTSEIDNRAGFAFILGKALAGSGKKVLIIDADFARPVLNLFTDTPCIYGLKDLLGGKNTDCRIDFQTEIENLSIAPSGTPDKKNQEKMNAEFWQLVINMFKRKYDFIMMVLPQLKKLGGLQLQNQSMMYLTLMDEDAESSVNDYFFSKIVLNKYNFSLFQPVNVFQK